MSPRIAGAFAVSLEVAGSVYIGVGLMLASYLLLPASVVPATAVSFYHVLGQVVHSGGLRLPGADLLASAIPLVQIAMLIVANILARLRHGRSSWVIWFGIAALAANVVSLLWAVVATSQIFKVLLGVPLALVGSGIEGDFQLGGIGMVWMATVVRMLINRTDAVRHATPDER